MYSVSKLAVPPSVEEALQLMQSSRGNTVLGGGCWLALSSKNWNTGIDLSALNLGEISATDGEFSMGAYTTLRQMETHPLSGSLFGGVLRDCVAPIVGVQLRNRATVGGSVYARFGFSDVICALLSLDCTVTLAKAGTLTLAQFLAKPVQEKDLFLRIQIKREDRTAAIESFRLTATDLPILNASASRLGSEWRVVVGARPARSMLSLAAAEVLRRGGTPQQAGEAAAQELPFGTNQRASAAYRKTLAKVLVQRAVEKAW